MSATFVDENSNYCFYLLVVFFFTSQSSLLMKVIRLSFGKSLIIESGKYIKVDNIIIVYIIVSLYILKSNSVVDYTHTDELMVYKRHFNTISAQNNNRFCGWFIDNEGKFE